MLSRTNIIILACVFGVIILALFIYYSSSDKKNEKYTSDSMPSPCEMKNPPPVLSTPKPKVMPEQRCMDADGNVMECGHKTKQTALPSSSEFMSEVKLINQGPVHIDVYYRAGKGEKQLFVASIPSGKFMYAYHAAENTKLRPGGQVFARFGKGTVRDNELLYLPHTLKAYDKTICFGAASSTVTHSKVVYNLLGEIMFIEFKNVSNASYDIYYYGDYLGTIDRFGTEDSVMRSDNGQRGYRLNSEISIIMKDTNIKQNLKLTNREMDTMFIGRIEAYDS